MTSLSCFLKDEEKAHRRSAISVYTGTVKEPEGAADSERVNRYIMFFLNILVDFWLDPCYIIIIHILCFI